MLGAIYVGLSGMNAYSRGLQLISNNVANLNTVGFKASEISFTDAFTSFSLGANYRGSTGWGVRIDPPGVDFRSGDLRQSGQALDLAIDGAGFLVLRKGPETFYTRTGSFRIDDDGAIVETRTGYKLGFLSNAGRLADLTTKGRTSSAQPTSEIALTGAVSAEAEPPTTVSASVFDAKGNAHNLSFTFDKMTGGATWSITVKDADGQTIANGIHAPGSPSYGFQYKAAGGDAQDIALDLTGVSFADTGNSNLRVQTVDGRPKGTLTDVSFTTEGKLKLTFSNGETETLNAVALARVVDTGELEAIGEGLFLDRGGRVELVESGKSAGSLAPGRLEASNVDLAQQFGDLILVQRGFQASSQVVSITNDMIQQLFGIRSQG